MSENRDDGSVLLPLRFTRLAIRHIRNGVDTDISFHICFSSWESILMSEEQKATELTADDLLDSIRSTISTSEIRSDAKKSGSSGRAAWNHSLEHAQPLVAAEAQESTGGSFATLTKAADAEDSASNGASKEHIMNEIPADAALRPLSQIEQDLLAAEGQYSDAEARRKKAEADARLALEGINNFQAEIDAAIDHLRRASPAGSNWSRLVDRTSNVLTLKEEVPNDPVIRANFNQ